MTYASLKSKLTTAATAVAVSNVFGYLDEANIIRTDTRYPIFVFIPPNKPLKTRTTSREWVIVSCELYIIDEWSRDWDSTQREATWDAIDTKAATFFAALSSTDGICLYEPDNIKSEPIVNGIIAEECIAVKYTYTLKLFC